MVEKVKYLLSRSIEEIISSSDSIDLIRCYSQIYQNGAQCGWCSASQNRYYKRLKQDGIIMAQKYEEIKKRTCVPAWKGNRYVPATGKHWNSEFITDEDAIYLLTEGHITEEKFTKLPEGYSVENNDVVEAETKSKKHKK